MDLWKPSEITNFTKPERGGLMNENLKLFIDFIIGIVFGACFLAGIITFYYGAALIAYAIATGIWS